MNRATALAILMMWTVFSSGNAASQPKADPKDLAEEGWNAKEDVDTLLEGYKEARWGMSPGQVKKAMPGCEFTDREGGFGYKSMYYKDDIAGETARVEFLFKKNELYMAVLKFEVDGWVDQMAVDKFDKFLTILTDKYGKPLVLNRTVPDAHLDDPAGGIADGIFELESNWRTSGTKISLKLQGTKNRLDRKSGFDFRVLYKAASLPEEPAPSPGSDL